MDIGIPAKIRIKGYDTIAVPPIKKTDTKMDLPKKEHKHSNKSRTNMTYNKDRKVETTSIKKTGSIIDTYA